MRKIFIFFTMILCFLFLTTLNVNAMTIPNTSEVKFYNLYWYELPTQVSDAIEYDLRVEVSAGVYEPIDAVLTYEYEFLKLYGVVVFNYPTSHSVITDEKTIMYKENYNSEQQVFNNVNIDYIKGV